MPDWLWQGLIWVAVSIPIAWAIQHIYHKKQEQKNQLVWCIWTAPLVQKFTTKEPGLQVIYNQTRVRGLGVSWILLWNSGKHAIKRQDIANNNPLRITGISGVKFQSVAVSGASDPGNAASVQLKDGAIEISFEYLNERQGILVSLVHTGTLSQYISVAGSVINGSPPKQLFSRGYRPKYMPELAQNGEPNRSTFIVSPNRHLLLAIAYGAAALVAFWFLLFSNQDVSEFFGLVVGIGLAAHLTELVTGMPFYRLFDKLRYRRPLGIEDINDPRLAADFWDYQETQKRRWFE